MSIPKPNSQWLFQLERRIKALESRALRQQAEINWLKIGLSRALPANADPDAGAELFHGDAESVAPRP